jgi:hypothetical protein
MSNQKMSDESELGGSELEQVAGGFYPVPDPAPWPRPRPPFPFPLPCPLPRPTPFPPFPRY